MARYLVTGGCGFIGSHLSHALIKEGHHITILDNLSSGKKENAPENAEIVIGDATDQKTVNDIIKQQDGCFHLAAIASVEQSNTQWLHCHHHNLTATITLFEAIAKTKKPIPVVYASSAAIYGNNDALPLTEHTQAFPLSAYAVDKYACELHGRIAHTIHHIPNTGLRLFNVYGPGQNPLSPYSGVISIYIHHLLNNKPLTIYGTGKQTRDFIYVSDVVSAFIAAMHYTKKSYQIFNVCTGQRTTIEELATILIQLQGKTSLTQKHYLPKRQGDVSHSQGSPAYITQTLAWKHQISIHKGLELTLPRL